MSANSTDQRRVHWSTPAARPWATSKSPSATPERQPSPARGPATSQYSPTTAPGRAGVKSKRPSASPDLSLLNLGYQPAWDPRTTARATTPESSPRIPSQQRLFGMAEPRARAARQKGQMNFSSELRLLLSAYGDPSPAAPYPLEPLPETVRVLDEIVTDFILELCHGAAQVAHHARRQKIKVDDFRFALRRDSSKLGRVQELLRMERELKEARRAFDSNDDKIAKDAASKKAAEGKEDGDGVLDAATSATGKKSKGKGKRAAAARRGSDATEGSVSKKRKTQ
ncbi:Transcription initiation factor TFIID subunit 13 [Penicillium chermesinum]|uniref:Transcription initiation factor TFIID subunit 13 n=1 Tax=Penicillium chermesinum TaxID=63820 RepID=A0A9W9PLI6_9EURO|nr:Transcription initiation factor TFIID subunit 13 [Penicillium chermesinum]KAJ5248753.1 Transcription initiation factor TFIID subunit 13 [Penicillium chermesinum]